MSALQVQEALIVFPGDKLLIRVTQGTSRENFDESLRLLKERFPDNEVTLIAAEQIAVVRGE